MNRLVSGLLTESFSDIWVSGEISGFRPYPSGHLYFSLKDEQSQIDAICFKSAAQALKFKLANGLEVVAHGRAEVYPARGKFQLVLDRFEPLGAGALQKAFEQLKQKLEAEGLFRPERKRPVPRMPWVVGIVTSPAGAAIQDMLETLRLHRAGVRVLLFPAQVQGEGAATQIAQGIRVLGERADVEVIIIGRGGGSLEDLWAFNEEVVARAVAASRVPVISGVGHEVDFTIADFVADVRAATPTAAAQLIARGWEEARVRLEQAGKTLMEKTEQAIFEREQRLSDLVRHRAFQVMLNRLTEADHRVEKLIYDIQAVVNQRVAAGTGRLSALSERLSRGHPVAVLLSHRAKLSELAARLSRRGEMAVEQSGSRFAVASGRLHAYSPIASLKRGYAICRKPNGSIVRAVGQVSAGETVEVRVSDGGIGCRVLERPKGKSDIGMNEERRVEEHR